MQCILLLCPRARDGVAGVMNRASEMVRMAKPLLDTEVSIIFVSDHRIINLSSYLTVNGNGALKNDKSIFTLKWATIYGIRRIHC